MKIIVIGAVAGGTGAATKARRNTEEAEIIVYEKGEYISYSGCAMPYYLSGEVKDFNSLVPRDAKFFKDTYNIDIKTKHEVIKINSEDKTIIVKDIIKNEEFTDNYDKLVIATGARSFIPPIKGADNKHVFGLRNINDMLNIKEYLDTKKPKKAVVIGAGFIGLEVVESFTSLGMEVTLVERLPQVSPGLDSDMAIYVEKELIQQKVNVLTNTSAIEITKDKVIYSDDNYSLADIVIIATGVTPNTEIAADAGITLGKSKGILVNEYMETNIKDIYATGDCTENYHLLTKEYVYRPLGSTANKTARIVGDNITNNNKQSFPGILGTSIYRIFDLNVAQTGLTEREAQNLKIDYEVIHNYKYDKYPYMGGEQMLIKAIADKKTNQFLGAQIVGGNGVDKRIDIFATALNFKAKVNDLINLDLAYAPPFNTAKDAVHYTGMILENSIHKNRKIITIDKLNELSKDDCIIIDVREKELYEADHLPNAINISQLDIRDNIDKIDFNKTIITYCGRGTTANAVQNTLINYGCKNVYNLSGGYTNYYDTKVDINKNK